MRKIELLIFVVSFYCLFAVSCKRQPQFTIEGVVENAGGDMVYLEKRNLTNISVLDSAKIDGDGSFSISSQAPEHPDLYVLSLNNQGINLSIDSIETIKIKASKQDFGTKYTVEGSDGTARIQQVVLKQAELTKEINELKNKYQNKLLSDDEFLTGLEVSLKAYKDTVKRLIVMDLKNPSAYFALFQKINGDLIFNPYDKTDSKMYSAVATAWDFHYKDTPRAKHLRDFTIRSINERRNSERNSNMLESAVTVDQAEYYNIELPNINNRNIALTSLKGKIVLLDFTAYQAEYSPLHNIAINKLYQKYKNNLEVYQVSFDPDEHFWQNAAHNLPWICVRSTEGLSANWVSRFNIQQLPTMFLLDRQGAIIKRFTSQDNIDEEIKKLM